MTDLPALFRWRSRIMWRALRARALGTLEGRLMIAAVAVSLPSVWHLLGGQALIAPSELDEASRVGALTVSHVLLSLCFMVVVPSWLMKVFVLDRAEEPLLAHPWALPDLRVAQVAWGILWASAYLWVFHYLFFSRLLVPVGAGRAVAPAHAAAAVLYLWVLGVSVAWAFRRWVVGSRLLPRARLAQRLAILPFLLTFTGFVLLPVLLWERAPGVLREIGDRSETLLYGVQAPLALATALVRGKAWVVVAWASGLVISGGGAGFALWRWRKRALVDLPVDLNLDRTPTYTSGFARLHGDGTSDRTGAAKGHIRPIRLFWIKDVALPLRREPLDFARSQILPLAVLTLSIAEALSLEGDSGDGPVVEAVLTTGLLVAIGLVATWRTLGSLGCEGQMFGTLRTYVSPGRLLGIKLAVNGRSVLTQAACYVLLFGLAQEVVGLDGPGVLVLLGQGTSAAAFVTVAGTAAAFLLPGFHVRSGPIPGASLAARTLFPPAWVAVLAAYVGVEYLAATAAISRRAFVWGVAIGTVLLGLALVGVIRLAVARLERLEP